ncbi:MAG: RNA-binding transcriptional accessory protein [Marinilabiliales bacterium]|nr:MAG: RNA-binding transcriptional accessory protein [Marinilabiliales bacterium]
MNRLHVHRIANELDLNPAQVENTIKLLAEGSTVPFISRYRKELTGSLDEVMIAEIKDKAGKLAEMDKRRDAILKSLEDQGNLTPELKQKIGSAQSITELEDIYLPYRPKRKTRASVARERGLEPLAVIMMEQRFNDLDERALKFLSDEVPEVPDALQGARDIVAEWVSENQDARNRIRGLFEREAVITSRIVRNMEEEGAKFRDYFSFEERLARCPSHRILALRRGEEEGVLKLSIEPPVEKALEILHRLFVKGSKESSRQVEEAVNDSYRRLLGPSIENEFRSFSKEKADTEAISVFAENLRQLLLAPPLGQKRILAIDPGYRTGCKVVCLDEQGNLLHNETIYPHPPQSEGRMAAKKIASLVNQYKIEAISIGNGTASRETENFIRKVKFDRDVSVFMVNESGASVYSASQVAREEFPGYDVTVRGAVSIGRRLSDPLAELVKIDPKSIGVGQYQHDVDQGRLKTGLDQVVESCVNLVGVNLNTASRHLLTYVSGLGPQLAGNIVEFRKENGPFASREDLKGVPRLGAKAFEQCAGFLRIPGAPNQLDNSAVHPESYNIVERMAGDMGAAIEDLIKKKEIREKLDLNKYVTETTGLPTLNDIMAELAKPGRDPRSKIEVFEFSPDVFGIGDLKPGLVLPGIVTNITNFGAFVDIGVKQDGLVHISQMADRFVKNPNDVVKLHQSVRVKVLEVDEARKRIQLSMKGLN